MVWLVFNGMAVPVLAGRICDWDMVGKVVRAGVGDCTERREACFVYWKNFGE